MMMMTMVIMFQIDNQSTHEALLLRLDQLETNLNISVRKHYITSFTSTCQLVAGSYYLLQGRIRTPRRPPSHGGDP